MSCGDQTQFFPQKEHTLACRKLFTVPFEQMGVILVFKGWRSVRNHQHLNKAKLSKTNIYLTGSHQLSLSVLQFAEMARGCRNAVCILTHLQWMCCSHFKPGKFSGLRHRTVRREQCCNLWFNCNFSSKNPKHLLLAASQMWGFDVRQKSYMIKLNIFRFNMPPFRVQFNRILFKTIKDTRWLKTSSSL